MRKNGRLYTVNKWNKNLFYPGGPMETADDETYSYRGLTYTSPQSNLVVSHSGPSWDEIAAQVRGLEKGVKPLTIKPVAPKPDKVDGWDVASGLATAASPALTGIISSGYSTGGIGEGISTVSNAIGSAVGAIPGVGKIAEPIVKLAGAISGGLYNRFKGVKENKENIAALDANTAAARSAGKALASSTSTDEYIKNSGNMVNSLGFNWRDLYENGWATDAGTRKGNAKLDINKSALAYQTHAGAVGADNVDYYNDANTLSSFKFAEGGFLPMVNTDNMGAIEYGFINDWLTNKKRQTESKGVLGGTLFAIGGDLQTNGADWSTGLTHINAGQSHELNPNEGVQVGVDSEGTPNLVEEGETIYNDYVYSNRIELDEEAKRAFHIGKKRDITYAEMSKKLEKEAAERPNDPISKAALQKQMEELANHQERQKQEMEAERAEEYFNSLSDEEKVALMQQVAGQQAQEEAMMQEAAAQQQPTQEEMMAAQQQVSPEEAAMMQQQQMQGIPIADAAGAMAQPMMAYGGRVNKFDYGGALRWLKKNYPSMGNKEEIAKAMEAYANKYIGSGANNTTRYNKSFAEITGAGGPTNRDFTAVNNRARIYDRDTKDAREHYQKLLDLGMHKKVAFGLAFPEVDSKLGDLKYPGHNVGAYNKLVAARNALYNELVRGNRSQTTVEAQVNKTAQATVEPQKTTKQKRTVYRALDGKTYRTKDEAYKVNAAIVRQRDAQERQAAQTGTAYAAQTATPEESASSTASNNNAGNTGASTSATTAGGSSNRAARPNTGDIVNYKYDWYRNGSDGYSTPTGFTVGDNGLIRQEDYTQAYKDLVRLRGAADIKDWARRHPDDPSLRSFLMNNYSGNNDAERLEAFLNDNTFTDAMWRSGATDGKYGFMHHVADELLQESEPASVNDVLSDEDKALIDKYAGSVVNNPDDLSAYKEAVYSTQPSGGPVILLDENGKYTTIDAATDDMELVQEVPSQYGNMKVYRRKPAAGGNADKDTAYDVIPVHRSEWPRYAGLFGPAVGLGMQLAGVGKPDYGGLDAALDAYDNRGSSLADYKPIGNYLTYRPMDIWAGQNRMDANSRATDRTIMNNAAPIGTQMAGTLANAYTSQLGSGQLYRNALEYNDNLRKQVADFNRATDMFNATAYNQASLQNAQIQNHDRALRAQLAMDAARQKMSADADWYKGIYGNVGGIFQGLSELGKENAQHNMIADMAATGILGTIKNQPIANGYVKVVPRTNTGKYGGKMKKKKRGLTC